MRLQMVYQQVNAQLEINISMMQRQYNKRLNYNDFKPGDRAWLKKKYYKSGENKKLSPRKTGPWTIMEKLPNGVNFKIKNDSTGVTQNVHHDRLIPVKTDKLGAADGVHPSTPDVEFSDSESEIDESSLPVEGC